jgi:hypothetical protein
MNDGASDVFRFRLFYPDIGPLHPRHWPPAEVSCEDTRRLFQNLLRGQAIAEILSGLEMLSDAQLPLGRVPRDRKQVSARPTSWRRRRTLEES